MSNQFVNNDLMRVLMSGQAGPNVMQKIDQNRQQATERQRAEQEFEALRRQREANLRGTQLQNTQQARQMAQKPQNQFKTIQGPDGNQYQVEVGPNGQMMGQPKRVEGFGQSPNKNDLSRLPQGAQQYLPPEIVADPNSVDKATFNKYAIEAVRQARTEPKQPTLAERKFEAANAESEAKQASAKTSALEKFGVIQNTADNAIKIIEDNPVATGGFIGGVNSNIPGTDAYSLERAVDTLKANLSFDELQRMRNASKTGGALGSVSERELQLLGSTVASLDSGLQRSELLANLNKVKDHYSKFLESLGLEAPQERITHPDFGDVSEADILETMRANNMTREEVLGRLGQ